MNISNDTPNMDYLSYFTTQMPKDLAAMAALRDELSVRQGALSAAEDAVKLKAEAVATLESANAEAAAVRAEAAAYVLEAKAQKTIADTREKAQNDRDDEFVAKSDAREKELGIRETRVQSQMDALDAKDAALFVALAQVDADRATLDDRIKAFQDKVASISV